MFQYHFHIPLIAAIIVVLVVPANLMPVNAAASYCLQFEQGKTMLANPQTGAVTAWPSGKQRHAYLSPDPARGHTEANLIAADGKHYYEIVTDVRPNSTTIDETLLVEDTANNTVTVLKRDAAIIGVGWAKWGTRIAYLWRDQTTDTRVSIRIVSADGRIDYGSVVLPSAFSFTGNAPIELDWSSDGAYLAINDSHNIYLLATDTLRFDPSAVISWGDSWQWSPSGHRFAVFELLGWLIGTPDMQNELITFNGTTAWSPNNRFVAIAHPADDPALPSTANYYISIFDTANNTSWEVPALDWNLFQTEAIITQPMYWSSDSRYLVYLRHRSSESPQNNDLMATDTLTRQEITLVQNLAPYDYKIEAVESAPSGNRYAVRLQDTDKGTVRASMVNPDGTGKIEFVHKAALIDGLSWSSDGNFVAYVAATTPIPDAIKDGESIPTLEIGKHNVPFQLVYAKADGSSQHILSYPQARILFWQAGSLVFIAGTPSGKYMVRRLDPLTGKLTVLADGISYAEYVNAGLGPWGYWDIYPSPAGDTVLLSSTINFAIGEGSRNLLPGPVVAMSLAANFSGVSVYLARWNGSQYRTLLESIPASQLDAVRWSPDGSMVALTIGYGQGLHIYAADGRLLMNRPDEIADMVWIPCR